MPRNKTKSAPPTLKGDRPWLGGSDIGAIMGVHPNRTALDVYSRKLGLQAEEPESPVMRRGKLFEHIAAQEYTRKTGVELEHSQLELVDPEYPYLRGHADFKKKGEPGIIEVKIPGLSVFARYKREGLPMHLIAQLTWYMGLLRDGAAHGEFVIFNTEMCEVKNFRVEFEAELFVRLRAKAVDFYENNLMKRIPPAIDVGTEELKAFTAIPGETTKIETPQFAEAMMMFQEVKRLKADHDYLEAIAKDKLKSAVGKQKGKYAGPGGRLYWTERAGRKTPDMPRLRAAEPIDRAKLIVAIEKNFGKGPYKKMLALLDDCRTDIDSFIKAGAPYDVLQAYFTQDDE